MPQQRGVGRFISKLLGGDAKSREFPGSAAYWESRYKKGGTSGAGSYAQFAEFKAEVLNEFVQANAVRSVIEFGCGDGNQLTLAHYPRYVGVDVSPAAVEKCRALFQADATKLPRYIGSSNERGGFSLVKLIAVNTPPLGDPKRLETASARLGEQVGRELAGAYTASLKGRADVKINQKALEKR